MSAQQVLTPVPTVEPSPNRPNGWVYLDELPTPSEVAEVIEAARRNQPFSDRAWRELLELSKFEYYFAGKVVEYLHTPRGLAVVATSDMAEPDIAAARSRLTPPQRARLLITVPPVFNEPAVQRLPT